MGSGVRFNGSCVEGDIDVAVRQSQDAEVKSWKSNVCCWGWYWNWLEFNSSPWRFSCCREALWLEESDEGSNCSSCWSSCCVHGEMGRLRAYWPVYIILWKGEGALDCGQAQRKVVLVVEERWERWRLRWGKRDLLCGCGHPVKVGSGWIASIPFLRLVDSLWLTWRAAMPPAMPNSTPQQSLNLSSFNRLRFCAYEECPDRHVPPSTWGVSAARWTMIKNQFLGSEPHTALKPNKPT